MHGPSWQKNISAKDTLLPAEHGAVKRKKAPFPKAPFSEEAR